MEALEALRTNGAGTFQLVLTVSKPRYSPGKKASPAFSASQRNICDMVRWLQDVMMPDVDGIQLLRHVRQDDSLGSVPVVSKCSQCMSQL